MSSLSPASADHVVPVPGPANAHASDCPAGTVGTADIPTTGHFDNGTFSVDTVLVDTPGGPTYDFSNASKDVVEVFVKGGNGSNRYIYDPAVRADEGVHAPDNGSGDWAGLSHFVFCYALSLDVSKTANTTYKRTWPWTIDKSVTPSTWDLFTGDTGTSDYQVSVDKGAAVDSDWAVSGAITIENNNGVAATITGVNDAISGGINAPVSCGVSFPHVLAANGTLNCTYTTSLPNGDDRTNTATVTTSGSVNGGTATAPVDFGDPTTVVNDTIHVTDSVEGDLGAFSDDGSASYSKKFTCADEGDNPNTATITETGQSDNASVTVNCYDLTVAKDASTSVSRTWTWDIDKSADQTDLMLSQGQLHNVNYEVEVSATSEDSAHHVEGDIIITNPNPTRDATLTQVLDEISDSIGAAVNCPALTVPAGLSLTCSYSADLPDGADRTNTATATLQNHDYASDGSATATGTSDFFGSAPVTFADATVTETDECVEVTDDNLDNPLGTVCAGDAPKTFSYSLTFGPAGPYTDVVVDCGKTVHTNTAEFTTNDTGTTGDDSWTVNVTVACQTGCTLTPGYWKTHSRKGPAPYDNNWANLGAQQENTVFFLSGKTYYQALWTAPKGNAYWILAHAYIAAQLNKLNGASVPAAVQTALNQATTLFSSKTPAQADALKGAARQQWISLAGLLDAYNNGLTGPGHCSEAP